MSKPLYFRSQEVLERKMKQQRELEGEIGAVILCKVQLRGDTCVSPEVCVNHWKVERKSLLTCCGKEATATEGERQAREGVGD